MRTFLKRHYRNYKKKRAIQISKNPSFSLPNGYKRIYHVHVRKSAGTSINAAFWELGDLSLKKLKREPIAIRKKLVFVRNNKDLIEAGNYFYANSHMPFWSLQLPEDTFTFCMLRDPYERLVSLYKYYLWVANTPKTEAIKIEPYYKTLIKHTGWLGNSFSDFLDNLPKKHCANQLFMFSENYDVKEALFNLKKISSFYFQENFDGAIQDLSKTLQLELTFKRERKFKKIDFSITEDEKSKALQILKDEYIFYNRLKKVYL